MSTSELIDLQRAIEATLEQAYSKAQPGAFPVLTNTVRIQQEQDAYRDSLPDPWRMDEALQQRLIKGQLALIQKTSGSLGRETQANLARDRAQRASRDFARKWAAKSLLRQLRSQLEDFLVIAERFNDGETARLGPISEEAIGAEDGQPLVAEKFSILRGNATLLEVMIPPRGENKIAWVRDGERHMADLESLSQIIDRLPERRLFVNWFDRCAELALVVSIRRLIRGEIAELMETSAAYITELFERWKNPEDEAQQMRASVRNTITKLVLICHRAGIAFAGPVDKDSITELQGLIDRRLRYVQVVVQKAKLAEAPDPKFSLYDLQSFRPELEKFLDRQASTVGDVAGSAMWGSVDLAKLIPEPGADEVAANSRTQGPVQDVILLAVCDALGTLVQRMGNYYEVDSKLGRVVEKPSKNKDVSAGQEVFLPHPNTEPKFISPGVGLPASLELVPRACIDVRQTNDATDRMTPAETTFATLMLIMPKVLGKLYETARTPGLIAMLKLAGLSPSNLEDATQAGLEEMTETAKAVFQLDRNTKLTAFKDARKLRMIGS
ncbi:hypothetical protein [Radicibacter daui]|uniref:hypothetical protein n=1 Tax=Radicibacter daui TaxID=3064829 RepID=UPI0040468D22